MVREDVPGRASAAPPPVRVGTVSVTSNRVVVAHGVGSAHELLRAEAARFHRVPPASIVLVHECTRCGSDAHGQPHLLPTAAVRRPAHVSLARAGDASVVAITEVGAVGVDVEVERAAGDARLGGVILHPVERQTISTDLTRTWVRKEALLKACGLGLTVDPSHVGLDDDGLVAWDSPYPRPASVWLRDVTVPGHVVAVAVVPSPGMAAGGLSVVVRPEGT